MATDVNFPSVLAYQGNYNYAHITGTPNALKSTEGILHTVTVNGGTTPSITIYDGTSTAGTVICQSGTLPVGTTLHFDVKFNNGLYITINGSSVDFTVSWL